MLTAEEMEFCESELVALKEKICQERQLEAEYERMMHVAINKTADEAEKQYEQDMRDQFASEQLPGKAKQSYNKAHKVKAQAIGEGIRNERRCNSFQLLETAMEDIKFLGELLRIALVGTRVIRNTGKMKSALKGDVTAPWPPIRWGQKCECEPDINAGLHDESCWRVCEEVQEFMEVTFMPVDVSQELVESGFSSMNYSHKQSSASRRDVETMHRVNKKQGNSEFLVSFGVDREDVLVGEKQEKKRKQAQQQGLTDGKTRLLGLMDKATKVRKQNPIAAALDS